MSGYLNTCIEHRFQTLDSNARDSNNKHSRRLEIPRGVAATFFRAGSPTFMYETQSTKFLKVQAASVDASQHDLPDPEMARLD